MDDFCAARTDEIPALLWPNFAPPYTILSDIPVAGLNYDFQLRTEHVQNICDNVYLKGSYPEGYGLSASIHHDFADAKTTMRKGLTREYLDDVEVLAEIREGQVYAFVGPYYSGTKYHVNGCSVWFDVDSVSNFDFEDYGYLSKPINVKIVSYTELPESGTDFVEWANGLDVLQERNLEPIYLFPFDLDIADLPKSEEHQEAITLPPRSDNEMDGFSWMRMIAFSGRDLPGADLETLRTDDLDKCTAACLGNPRCVAVTVDRWNNLCFLKDSGVRSSELSIQPKATTYVRPSLAFDLQENDAPAIMKHRKGKGFDSYAYETLTEPSYGTCAARCVVDDQCLAVNFHADSDQCEKMSAPYAYDTMQGVEIGIKLQLD